MPIKIPNQLPSKKILTRENIFTISEKRAQQQDIRPLEVVILNLMSTKIETETQLARLLGNTPLQVNFTLLTTKSYHPKNTPAEHLISFYKTFDDICNQKFDGLIVTGAPVEHLNWQDVEYWDELKKIFKWSLSNVHSSFFICWGAQAALQYFHKIPKHILPEKKFGVFCHSICKKNAMLLRGFDDEFWVPVSRHTEMSREDLAKVSSLEILAESRESGVFLVRNKSRRQIFSFNHPEYDAETLKNEYERDCKKLPENYFPSDNLTKKPRVRWRAHANLLFSNWLNYYVYQQTPFDLSRIKKKNS